MSVLPIRPTSRVVSLALGLAASGASLLLLGGVALADTTITTDSGAVVDNASTTVSSVTTDATTTVEGASADATNSAQVTPETQVADATTNGTLTDATGVTPESTGTLDTEGAATAKTTAPAATADELAATLAAAGEAPKLTALATAILTSAVPRRTTVSQSLYSATSQATVPAAASSSTPGPEKLPFKSDGLLDRLSSNLAATVVPVTTRLAAIWPLGRSTDALFIIFLLLTSVAIFQGFGQLLRRSGYTRAARSDLPASFFAPPHLMGYVWAVGHIT